MKLVYLNELISIFQNVIDMRIFIVAIVSIGLISCLGRDDSSAIDDWKKEIFEVEAAFAAMAKKEGIGNAFAFYAADSAVLLRSKQLIKGRKEIAKAYMALNSDSITLNWSPDFIDVAASGDLAYTYGRYVLSQMDSTGNITSDTGIFHTVWKRQSNGEWRFVWD